MPPGELPPDAYPIFAVFTGVGMAMWNPDQVLRLTFLWLALLGNTLTYASGRRIEVTCSAAGIGRRALSGPLVSLPLVLLARGSLCATSQRLLPMMSIVALFWGLVLVMPTEEALYFRGLLQGEKGLRAAAVVADMALPGFVYS